MSVQVRQSTYRGKVGWLISGAPKGDHRRVSIFTETRTSADRIADKVRRGERTTTEDFAP